MTIEIDPLETQRGDLDDGFRRHAFALLRKGEGVPVTEVCSTSPDRERAYRSIESLIERGMAQVESGVLVGVDGLSLRPTRHRMRLGRHDLYTWCAADAVGIPAALEEDARVETSCLQCGVSITVEGEAGRPRVDGELVLWLPTNECSHLISQFCPDVSFFCDASHVEAWLAERPGSPGEKLSVDQVAELSREWWAYLTATEKESR